MAPAITIYASPTADAFVQAASSPSSNSTSTASGTSKMSDTQLVLTSDLILLLVVVFLGLCALPRILVRFRGVGKQGWMIQHNTQAKAFSLERKTSTSSTIKKYGYEESDPYSIKAGLVRKYPSLTLLPHFPSYATLFHPVSSLFKYSSTSLHTRFTIGQFVVYIFYAFYILLNLFLGSSPVTNPQRAGWVAVSQLPVAVLLASKNNWVGMVVGKGYEKLNYLHRWVGQLIFVSTLFHVVSYLVKWTAAHTLKASISTPAHVWGLVALGAVSLLAIVSLPFIRNRFYTLFYYSHLVGLTTLLIAVSYHAPQTLRYTLPSLALYSLDLTLRVYKSHLASATLTYLPSLNTTRVHIPSLTSGWRAGQHVRIRVGMGGLKGWGEVHPFTIASAADGEGIELLIKEGGDWTRQLASFAKAGNQFDLESGGMGKPRPLQLLKGLGSGRSVNVLVEGPYGGPCHSVVSSYSAALIVCGGSGISYGIALLSEIVRDAEDGKARVRVGEMVWVVRDPASLAPVLPTLTSLLARASEVPGLSIQVTVYYTKAQAPNSTPFDFNRSPQQAHYFKSSEKPSPLLTRNGSNSSQKSLTLPPHLSLHPSRPSIPSHLTSLIQLTRSLKNGAGSHGVVIACCGTDGLREDVKNAERGVERLARNQVGGVEVLDEGFSW